MKMDLLSLYDWTTEEILDLIELGIEVKKNPQQYQQALKGKTLLMIFEKPSLRTRVSFEVGMTQLGGHAIYYDVATSPLGKKETIEDTAKTASRYVDLIMARLNHFTDTLALAQNSSVPVIDALSDMNHPCQILGDLLTIQEKKGTLKNLTLTYFGDCENNVTYSLMHGCSKVGMDINLACPEDKEFMPQEKVIKETEKICQQTGAKLVIHHNAVEGVKNADIIYTDSWMSYHIDAAKKEARLKKLQPFQVTKQLMSLANKNALFMHCLPAWRGYEQTAEVIDGPQSVVFDQAENRLHIQKAIMIKLLNRHQTTDDSN